MKQCLNKLFILLLMLRPRKLLHLMANISESIFHFFTITVFFKCVISLKLHLHVKFKKKKLLFFFPVIKNSQHNEADRIFIGRSGISVMYSYHKALQWIKVYWTIETWLEENEWVISFLDVKLCFSSWMAGCATCLPTILVLLNCLAGSKHFIVLFWAVVFCGTHCNFVLQPRNLIVQVQLLIFLS